MGVYIPTAHGRNGQSRNAAFTIIHSFGEELGGFYVNDSVFQQVTLFMTLSVTHSYSPKHVTLAVSVDCEIFQTCSCGVRQALEM